jgi:hypothetical protein
VLPRTKNKRKIAPNSKEKNKIYLLRFYFIILINVFYLFVSYLYRASIQQVPFEIDNLVKVAFRLFSVCNGGSLLIFDFFSGLLTAYGSTFCNSSYTELHT